MSVMPIRGDRVDGVVFFEEFRNILIGKSVQILITLTMGFIITSKFIRYRKSRSYSAYSGN